uniref:Macaca fascicularis brain cDNA clone: QflA-10215, similar to human hypothetical protein LOC145757 (LOC145757), mRNA, RefSeq: XM_378550.1 n=1 Tax=Macaca fascicularis TaxID=9541 RepID=I7GAG9_MACFA|nr:unnamed protein product [Macaca fascicularis]
MSVIPILWEVEMVDCLSPGVPDQCRQHGKDLYLQKNIEVVWA